MIVIISLLALLATGAGWWLALVGAAVWLHGHGSSWGAALGFATLGWVGLSFVLLGLWLRPPKYRLTWTLRNVTAGALLGLLAGRFANRGLEGIADLVRNPAAVLTPMVSMLPAIVGAGLVIALQNYLAASDFPVTVLIGIIFVICVLLFRRGIVGEILEFTRRRSKSAA